MTAPQLLISRTHRTASGSQREGIGASELQKQIRSRLGHLALFTVGLTIALQVILHIEIHALGWTIPEVWGKLRGAHFSLIVFSLLVFGLTRWRELPDDSMPTLGLGYQVLGAFLLALPGFSSELLLADNMARVPWVGIWIALFPLVVPLPPMRCVIVSLLSATIPLLIFLTWAVSSSLSPFPSARVMTSTFLPIYLAASLAVLPALVLSRLYTSVTEAEDQVRNLGSYRLVDLLGRGGMGEVWRAEHQLLSRPAAVKLISPELLGDDDGLDQATAVARFEREARATSALRSPHTIALYDYGVASDGSLFYVMEHLEGLDLETLVTRFGPISPSRVVHILKQACCSLAEAHQAGLIHRDIKPANIYLCRLGLTVDFVKILDFGLVGVNENLRKTGDVRLTDDDHIVGTPAYMPPEMASGAEVDRRADLYSLGCVAFWLLTGQFLFMEESAVKMIISHVKDAPDRPSKRLKKPIPEDLEQVILSCLAKDPADRPKDAEELAQRLSACDIPAWTQASARGWWAANVGDVPVQELSTSAPTATWPNAPASEPEVASS